MHRETFAKRLDLSAAPIHGAPSPHMLTDTAEIAVVLDGRQALELGRPQLLLDVPARTMIGRRTAERALQRCHRSIEGTLTPARHATEGATRGASLSAEEVKKAVEPYEADQDEIDRDNIVQQPRHEQN